MYKVLVVAQCALPFVIALASNGITMRRQPHQRPVCEKQQGFSIEAAKTSRAHAGGMLIHDIDALRSSAFLLPVVFHS